MCNQAVSLVAAELERSGIRTVCLQLLREVAEKVRPPRALFMPFPHGYPLGRPHDVGLQSKILKTALALLDVEATPSLLRDFPAPAESS